MTHPLFGVGPAWLESPRRSVLPWRASAQGPGKHPFFSPLLSPARKAGGFGCLRGKTNTLPQISSSHSLELVLAKTAPSGDSTEVQANHTLEERGPCRGGLDGLGGAVWRSRGRRVCPLRGNFVKTKSQEGPDGAQVSWLLSLQQAARSDVRRLPRCWQRRLGIPAAANPGPPGASTVRTTRRRKFLLRMISLTAGVPRQGKFKRMALGWRLSL